MYEPNSLEAGSFDASVKRELEEMGHSDLGETQFGYGDANSILIREGLIEAASDPRNVGGAAAY